MPFRRLYRMERRWLLKGQADGERFRQKTFLSDRARPCLKKAKSWSRLCCPPPPPHSGAAYLRFIPREEMDIAVAGVGSFVQLNPDDHTCEQARISLAAVAPTPVRAKEAEAFLAGRHLDDTTISHAGELASQAASPISDVRGSAAYRIELIKVLTRRTLGKALARTLERTRGEAE